MPKRKVASLFRGSALGGDGGEVEVGVVVVVETQLEFVVPETDLL